MANITNSNVVRYYSIWFERSLDLVAEDQKYKDLFKKYNDEGKDIDKCKDLDRDDFNKLLKNGDSFISIEMII